MGRENEIHYANVVSRAVCAKWTTAAEREWWYAKFTMSLRRKLLKLHAAQDGKCVFCGCDTWLTKPNTNRQHPPPGFGIRHKATADHKLPQSLGGTNSLNNLVMACSGCNNERQTIPFEEFLRIRGDRRLLREFRSRRGAQKAQNDRKREASSRDRLAALIQRAGALLWIINYPDIKYSG